MDLENDERFKNLGFKPQHENIYCKLLPYADKLDEESTQLFRDIKTNLVKSVLAREMRPGCAIWTARLLKYIRVYGLKFSKEDHISLIKLYYELVTIPNLDPIRINKFCQILRELLKKKLLSPEDLQLDWRPLYDMFIRVTAKSKSEIGMLRYYSNLDSIMETVIRFCRIYFPVESTQEILDEFRPKLTLNDVSAAMQYLGLFLPIIMKPDTTHLGYELWLDELMKFWEISHSSNGWENRLTWLVARLSYYNPGLINWEPYVPTMFVRFRRVLKLPVSYRKRQSVKNYAIDSSATAMWIVFSIGGKSDTVLCHLEKLMQSLETYFHSANSGKWSHKIREILKELSYYFVERVYLERHKKLTWEKKVPDDFKLTDHDIERFVNILKPCLEQAMFSRTGNQDVSFAMQYLSALRPDIIIPIVLDKVYSAMDSVTEPHKLISSMVCLMSVARYMVQDAKERYPNGPTHIFPLLTSLLPGIDPNDSKKCMMTFNLISHFSNLVPLIDSSEASKYYDDLTEEEHEICEASAYLEDFILQFFEKIFIWIESNSLEFTRHEQSDNNYKNKFESLSENALFYVTTSVLQQCSPKIYTTALKKLHTFATNRILESKISGKLMAILCACFVKVNRKETMKLFFPNLFDTIESLLGENDDVIMDEEINAELHYNLLILAEMLDGMSELLNYMDRIIKILDRILHMNSVQGARLASRMLSLIMTSLSFIQPLEHRSCNQPYSDDVKEFFTVREWGQPYKISDINIKWYQPGKAETECIQNLINRYLVPELEILEKYANGEVKLERRELCLRMRIISAILGCQSVLPLWQEPNIELINSVLDSWNFELTIGEIHVVTLPDGRNVRKVIADTLHKVQKKILEVDEGDTKTIHNIVYIYNTLLFNKSRGRDFNMHWKRFHLVKKYLEDRLHQSRKHLRFVIINRALLQQDIRTQYRTYSFTETHKQILLDLFELSTSNYSEVRIGAQYKLFNMMDTFPYSYRIIIPKVKEILQLDSTVNHKKFKGCLYVLIGTKSAPIITRHDWILIEELWPLVINSKPSEKLSIIRLMLSLAEAIKQFPTIQITFYMPDSCIATAYKLVNNVPTVSLEGFQGIIDNSPKLAEIENEKKVTAYTGVVNLLLDACRSGNLHWRYYSMAVGFIRDLVHADVKYSPQVVNFCLNSLINESLEIRKMAIRIFTYILLQNKPKYKKLEIDPYGFSKIENHKLKPGIRPDNEWLLYNSTAVPRNALEWDKPRYVHKRYIGYYDWPKPLKVYASSQDQPSFLKRMDNLSDQEKEILKFFNEKTVETLIKYLSLEEKKGRDTYNGFRFLVFKYLFKIFEDHFLNLFVPHLERLIKDNQEQSQRCAAEIIGGIIRGSKHWSFDKIENLWSILLPILNNTFLNMTDETINDWCLCFSMALHGRDPNRHHWLLEFLMQNPLNGSTSFITTCRLQILQLSLNQQCWRNVELSNRLLCYLNDHLSHPFQNVRDKISSSLTVIFSEDIGLASRNSEKCPKVQDFFRLIMPKLNQLYESTIHKVKNVENQEAFITTQLELISLENNDREASIRLFKTVCKYVTGSIARINYAAVPEHYELLPLACVLQSNDTDDELTLVCSNLLAIMGHTLIFKDYVPVILTIIKKVSICPFWSARAVIAEFIPVLVFHNFEIILSQNNWVLEIQNIVLALLEDMQPEVRATAAKALSGFLHCNFLSNPLELLSEFKKKSRTKLRNRKVGTGNQTNIISNSNNSFCIRHAAVLGMCAFINAHPYDVPDYLSDIFLELGKHLNDPQPIPTTIRNTLGDFKRTHHDNWEVHKLKFTEDELCLLSDLTVPPSYYA